VWTQSVSYNGAMHLVRPIVLVLLLVASLAACAPKQKISLSCVPREVAVYVDGRRLEEIPDKLKLRSDEHHALYFKGGGFENELVVLRTEEVDGKYRLTPSDLCSQARFVETRPQVTVEPTPEVSDGPD